jgi:hypothetical protein
MNGVDSNSGALYTSLRRCVTEMVQLDERVKHGTYVGMRGESPVRCLRRGTDPKTEELSVNERIRREVEMRSRFLVEWEQRRKQEEEMRIRFGIVDIDAMVRSTTSALSLSA